MGVSWCVCVMSVSVCVDVCVCWAGDVHMSCVFIQDDANAMFTCVYPCTYHLLQCIHTYMCVYVGDYLGGTS